MLSIENKVTYKGKPITLVGDSQVRVGEKAPNFKVSKSMEEDLELDQFKGRVVVLNVVPSIDTPICASQTATFNARAAELGDDVVVITVSMDLPFAIQRWCEEHGVDLIETTSDYKYQDFGRKFSLLMRGLGLLARSVFVLNREHVLVYEEIVPAMEEPPNYDAAWEAIAQARS